MPIAVQIDDDAYAIAKAFAEESHCSVAIAVSTLVVKSGFKARTAGATYPATTLRFPLVRGIRKIDAEDVAQLEDEL